MSKKQFEQEKQGEDRLAEVRAHARAIAELEAQKAGPSGTIRVELVKKQVYEAGVPGLEAAAFNRLTRQLSQAEVESGQWVKIADAHRECNELGIPISRLVKAFGGDREGSHSEFLPCPEGETSNTGHNSHFFVMRFGRTRYIPASSMVEGLAQLHNMTGKTNGKKAEPVAEGELPVE